MTNYEKAVMVMDYLQDLGVNIIAVAVAVEGKNLEKSYKLI
jgi:sulfur carrier protein ThiS